MAENSKIEWCDHTFNPVVGCTKVSAACDACYAESWAKRTGQAELWNGERRRTSPALWRGPVKWNAAAMVFHAQHGRRQRVFCASLADVFDNQWDPAWRADLWSLIRSCPNLDFLLLTKRPQNIAKMLPADWPYGYTHVWLGMTAENQEEYDRRYEHLSRIDVRVRFISYEPALGPLRISGFGPRTPDWVIAGGESGPKHRPPDMQWFRDLRDECATLGVPYLFKQIGGRRPKDNGRLLDGLEHNGFPNAG